MGLSWRKAARKSAKDMVAPTRGNNLRVELETLPRVAPGSVETKRFISTSQQNSGSTVEEALLCHGREGKL